MPKVPAAVVKRLTTSIPRYRKILEQARERDVNEADTVTIVTDLLDEVFGFDKYSEITREYAIQGTYCDLAVTSAKKVDYLIEVKAIGIELKDVHIRQAVTYASQEGIKWVVLTNGIHWEIYRVTLDQKVESTKLFEFNFLELNPRKREDQESLFLLCKRGVQKDLIDEFYEYRQSVNRYTVGAVILSEPVVTVVRRELRRIKEGLKVSNEEIEELIANEVIKRELLDSEAGKDAQKSIDKAARKRIRAASKSSSENASPSDEGEKII